MKVIIDLMEAYSDHIGLPLLLVNLDGKIDYKICGDENWFTCHDPIFLLSELKNTSLKQNKPTIISILEESIQASLFYIITPIFKFRNSQFFVVAGPCLLETENIENSNQFHLNIYNDDEIEDKLCKIRNLYSLLANKDMIETKLVLPEEIINILQKVGSFDCDKLDNDFYIFNSLDEFLNVDGIDFIGIAKKNEADIYVIQHINGENVLHLLGKRFYLGEGLLGNAAIVGKDFNWKKNAVNAIRPEFLNRYGIFPTHLFGLTITNKIIIFGGNFNEKPISDHTLKLVKFIMNYVLQKKQIKIKVKNSEHLQSILITTVA